MTPDKVKEIIDSYWAMFIRHEFDQRTPWFDQWAKTDEAAAIISSLVGLESSENLIKVLRMIQQELACATNSSNGGKANLNSALALVSAALEQIDNRKNAKICPRCNGKCEIEAHIPGNVGVPEKDIVIVCPDCDGSGTTNNA